MATAPPNSGLLTTTFNTGQITYGPNYGPYPSSPHWTTNNSNFPFNVAPFVDWAKAVELTPEVMDHLDAHMQPGEDVSAVILRLIDLVHLLTSVLEENQTGAVPV